MARFLTLLEGCFASWRFAASVLGLVAAYEAWLLAMLLVPAGEGPLAAFAAEFRAWCFGAGGDGTGSDTVQVFAMLTSPLLLVAVVLFVWGGALRAELPHRRRRMFAQAAGAAAVGLALGSLSMASFGPRPTGALPFPAAALRTAVPAPDVDLVDHTGAPFRLADERGRVVLLTAVYSTCGYTCPGLLADLDAAVAALTPDERADLRVVIPTLDPVRDTRAVLAEVADKRGFRAPFVRMLTGEPERVERALDRLGFERRRDPATGVIDHPNLFVLVDRSGRVAYRLGLGEPQRPWLVAALRTLLHESRGP